MTYVPFAILIPALLGKMRLGRRGMPKERIPVECVLTTTLPFHFLVDLLTSTKRGSKMWQQNKDDSKKQQWMGGGKDIQPCNDLSSSLSLSPLFICYQLLFF